MSKRDEHITQQELIDYHENRLSDEAMHSIEFHALECEFCDEALDGYAMLGDEAKSSLTNLTRRIETRVVDKPVTFDLKRILAIAASFLIFGIGAFLYYGADNNQSTESLALVVEKENEYDKPMFYKSAKNKEKLDSEEVLEEEEDLEMGISESLSDLESELYQEEVVEFEDEVVEESVRERQDQEEVKEEIVSLSPKEDLSVTETSVSKYVEEREEAMKMVKERSVKSFNALAVPREKMSQPKSAVIESEPYSPAPEVNASDQETVATVGRYKYVKGNYAEMYILKSNGKFKQSATNDESGGGSYTIKSDTLIFHFTIINNSETTTTVRFLSKDGGMYPLINTVAGSKPNLNKFYKHR
ncbi:MAG: hypothetical protein HRT72_00805 [Flavobacteriales bacterium]|nr:hypothetical protein [Flavobacteriales bacterium]